MKQRNPFPIISLVAAVCAAGPLLAQSSGSEPVPRPEASETRPARPDRAARRIEAGEARDPARARPESRVEGAWKIGLTTVPIDDLLRAHLDIPKPVGCLVKTVVEGSPADKAGIRTNDIILSADRAAVSDEISLRKAVQAAGNANKMVVLSVIHKGSVRDIEVKPAGPPPVRREAPERRDAPPQAGEPGVAQNRRFEEMSARLRRMQQQLENQEARIKRLEQQLAKPRPANRERPGIPQEARPMPGE